MEFGCGYGTFTIAAAQLTTGIVHALDIDADMLSTTVAGAPSFHLANINPIRRDFVSAGTGLDDASVGYAILFNILHAEDPIGLLREARRVLRPGGKVAVTHAVYDVTTPRGPDLSIRPRPEQCQGWSREAGFELVTPFVTLPPYHYEMVVRSPVSHV